MSDGTERNLGKQPLASLLEERELKSQDLVAASTQQLNHKMVSRACKGRRLTPNVKGKVLEALQRATGDEFRMKDLFNY